MTSRHIRLCPNLQGIPDGLKCSACDKLVIDIQDGNTDLCMSSHYEICSMYVSQLYREDRSECDPSQL